MIRIQYANGHTDTIRLTMLDQVNAEAHAQDEAWNQGGLRHGLYAAYWHLRHTGKTTKSFDSWCEQVIKLTEEKEPAGKSAGIPEASAS